MGCTQLTLLITPKIVSSSMGPQQFSPLSVYDKANLSKLGHHRQLSEFNH